MPVLNLADDIKLGSSQVDRVYLGATEVWSSFSSPADIAGLSGWYDADTPASLTVSAQKVSAWNDLSGDARHFAQATGASQPLLLPDVLAGRSVVAFDGRDDFMAATGGILTGASGATVFMVAREARATGGTILSDSSSTDADTQWSVTQGLTERAEVTSVVTNDAGTNFVQRPDTLINGWDHDFHVITVIDDLTAVRCYVDGAVGLWASGVKSGDYTTDTLAVGARSSLSGVDSHTALEVGELVIYDRHLSDSDRVKVETYLASRWSLSLRGLQAAVSPFTTSDAVALAYTPSTSRELAAIADIPSGQTLREQDDVVYDPTDDASRRYKFYFTAMVASSGRAWVSFSADGQAWGDPVECILGASVLLGQDFSVVTKLSAPGEVYRDGDGFMYMTAEVNNSEIAAYQSTDGITWTVLNSGDPVIDGVVDTWESSVGSPNSRHDGTQFIIGYEGYNPPAFGIAYGASLDAVLTKLAANPVWDSEPLISDGFWIDDAKMWFTGRGDGPFRGVSNETTPLTWTSGDIDFTGRRPAVLSPVDFTLDFSVDPPAAAYPISGQLAMLSVTFVDFTPPAKTGAYVRGVRVSLANTTTTSFPVDLPPSEVGDMLVVVVRCGGAMSTPAGWTSQAANAATTTVVYSKVSAGETSVSVTVASATRWAAVAYTVAGVADVEAAYASGLNPPSLSPSWGTTPLWVTSVGCFGTSLVFIPPSGFGAMQRVSTSSGSTIQNIASSVLAESATTLDPGVWTVDGTDSSQEAFTIAFEPA